MRYLLNKIFSHKSINCTLLHFCAQYILTFGVHVTCHFCHFCRFFCTHARAYIYIYYIYKRNKKDNYIHNSLSSKEKFS